MQPRQRRYFAGRAPGNEDCSDDDSGTSGMSDDGRNATSSNQRPTSTARATPQTQPVKISKLQDTRTRRRSRIQAKVVSTDDGPPVAKDAPDAVPSNPLQHSGFVRVEDEDEDAEAGIGGVGENFGDGHSSSDGSLSSDDSGSDSSSDSESQQSPTNSSARNRSPPRAAPAQAPVFIPRAARVGIGISSASGKRGKSRDDAQVAERRREAQKEEREREARADMLSGAREKDEADYDLQRVDMASFPDDKDHPENQEMEFQLWRVRELKRIMRERGMDVDGMGAEGEECAHGQQETHVH